jgi:NRPS condensation-like uncharacterized protein
MTKTAIDIDDLKGLKVLCAEQDITIKDFVNAAITEKRQRYKAGVI